MTAPDLSRPLFWPPSEVAAAPTEAQLVESFDAFHRAVSADVFRFMYLLTANRGQARRATRTAFDLAWLDWTEIRTLDRPETWVRAVAADHALGPRHRLVYRCHRGVRYLGFDHLPKDPGEMLLHTLQELPPHRRRALVLHHQLGLNTEEIAAETESTTAGAEDRLQLAHEDLDRLIPGLTRPGGHPAQPVQPAHERISALLTQLSDSVDPPPDRPEKARADGRFRAYALIGAVGVMVLLLLVLALPKIIDPGHSKFPEKKPTPGQAQIRTP
jgi:RNA polymerase sigma-70 factor (ECF subfamily)